MTAQPPNDPTDPASTATHVAGPGDHVERIAAGHGFRRLATVWDDGANAAIKKQRVNPHTLAPGDAITLPALTPFETTKATEAIHRLVVASTGLLLNLKLQDFDRQPLANRFYRLVVGERSLTEPGAVPSAPVTDTTNAKGGVSQPIPVFASFGEIVVHAGDTAESPVEATFRLLIGLLPPANTVEGLQIRLNNLGYFAGFSAKDTAQLKWAVEEFEHDHGLKASGKFDDPKTFNRIAHEHGDLLASEKVP